MALVSAIFLAIPIWLQSYSERSTHPALTYEMIALFNESFPKLALSKQEIEWVIQGSRDEDIWPRWINHFYNPTTNSGWGAQKFGWFPSSMAINLAKLLLSDYPPVPSKYWAVMPNIQAQYKNFGGDRTWQRALYEWSHDNKYEAYYTLGHILHLLEDATVPDHTRDDTHAHPLQSLTGDIGSPYELYAEQYIRDNEGTNLPITASALFAANFRPIILSRLVDYFEVLAGYSHSYFFSKDTIIGFPLPVIISSDDDYGYGKDKDGGIFLLARKRLQRGLGFSLNVVFSLNDPIYDAPILEAYFKRLSKEAILYGAGAIKLFRDEADEVKQSNVVLTKPQEKKGVVSLLNSLKNLKSVLPSATLSPDDKTDITEPLEYNAKTVSVVFAPVTPYTAEASSSSFLPELITISGSGSSSVAPQKIENSFEKIFDDEDQVVHIQPFSFSAVTSSDNFSYTAPSLVEIVIANVLTSTVGSSPETDVSSTINVSSTTTLTVVSNTLAISNITTSTIISLILPDETFTTTTTTPTTTLTTTPTTTTEVLVGDPAHIIINEIAWAGTSSDYPLDEWIELYNPTDSSIDLAGWKIVVGEVSVYWQKINNMIVEPKGYFLLEKRRDETLREITADVVYGDAILRNTGDKVALYNVQGGLVDEVDFLQGWPEQSSHGYRSLERIDSNNFAFDSANWRPSNDFRMLGKSYNGGLIYGSPRQANNGNVALNYRQEAPVRILKKEDNPYLLGYYEIPIGFKLIIGPGVVIKGYYPDSKMDIFGELEIQGNAAESVRMTSGKPQPKAGDWQGLWFHPGSVGNIVGLVMEYAGKDFRVNNFIYTGYVGQAIRAEQADLSIVDSFFRENSSTTLYAYQSTFSVSHSSFATGKRAIEALGGNVHIESARFDSFIDPAGPIWIIGSWPNINEESIFINNVFNGPTIIAASLTSSARIFAAWPYHLNNIIVPTTTELIIDPGANIRLDPAGVLQIDGSLLAVGTDDLPIHFLPFDPVVSWGSLRFKGSGILRNIVAVHGNNNYPLPPGAAGMVMVENGKVAIEKSVLLDADNAGNTILSNFSDLQIVDSLIGQSEKRAFPTTGIGLNGGSLFLTNVTFKNLETGIRNQSLPLADLYQTSMDDNFINVDYHFDPPLFDVPSL